MPEQGPARWFKNKLMKRWYTLISRADVDDLLHFMNYGYSDEGEGVPLAEAAEAERYPLQLYHHVASRVDLNGKDVLEVGCGRGGGLAYVHGAMDPRAAVGVDLNPFAIEFCRREYHGPEFHVMDAQALELPNEHFDVVLNVESSHRYPHFDRFVREVYRVLRPGGSLLFADFRWSRELNRVTAAFRDTGFITAQSGVINTQVCAALRLDEDRRVRLIREYLPLPLRGAGYEFAGVPGTRLYKSLVTGRRTYLCLVLEKPAIVP